MNEISELLYIVDTDTYELLFLNEAGRRTFYDGPYYGKKCYEVLQHLDEPCPFCNNQKLKLGESVTWEHTNHVNHRHYLLKDRLISWNNRSARMEIAFDMTEHENEKNKIRYMLEAEQMLVGCIRELYKKQDITESINAVLKTVGEFLNSDRAYIFNKKDHFYYNDYEWCKAGVEPQKDKLQDMPLSLLERWEVAFGIQGLTNTMY